MVRNEIQIRPVLCGLGKIRGMASFRRGVPARESFVDADVVEAGLLAASFW